MQTPNMRIRKTMTSIFSIDSDSDLDEVKEVEDKEDEEEEWDPAEEEEQPPPNVGPSSGSPKAAEMFFSSCKTSEAKQYADRFPEEYGIRAPTAGETAHNPPAGYATVFVGQFKCGLTLPLPPLVLSVLTHYNIALAQLIPTAIFTLLRFTRICETLEVDPTLALFLHYFKIRKYSKHVEGCYTFVSIITRFVREGEEPPNSACRDWTNSFLFFKTAPLSDNVNFSWNHSPIMNVPLVGNEMPSAQVISKFEAYAKRHQRPHESEEEEWSDLPRLKRHRKIAECSNAEPKDVADSGHQRPLQSEESNAKSLSVPSLEDMTPEQFACHIQKWASSFSRLKIDNDHLQKVVDAQEKDLKVKDDEISLLQRENVELRKIKETLEHNVMVLEHNFKAKDSEIASVEEDKAELQTRNDLLESKVFQLEDSVRVGKVELQKIMAVVQKMLGGA